MTGTPPAPVIGCWLELTIDPPQGMSDEELKAEVLPDGHECAFRGLLDLRRACAGVIDVESETVRFYLQYERWVH